MTNRNTQQPEVPGLCRLQVAYQNRLDAARAAHLKGQKVVGYVGNTVPVELILAAECMPVRIAPVSGDTSLTDRYVETFSDTDVRLIFAAYCAGEYDFLDLLVIPRSTESQHKLYLSVREAWRTGIVSKGPELWLYDILHTQRESSRAYGLARTHDLLHRLAGLAGAAPDGAALGKAISMTNDTRNCLQELQRRRLTRPISGREALVATGATLFLPPGEANGALHEWLDADQHSACGGPRLLVKGCPLDHDQLHALVERAGGRVVAEDDEWGARAAAPLIAMDRPPMDAIFEYYWRDVPCVRLHPATGDVWFEQALSPAIFDAVLFYLPPPDDIHGWSFPAERDQAKRAGMPWLLVRQDARESGPLQAQLTDFISTLIV